MNEFDLIQAFLAPLAGPEGLALQDDAALYTPSPGQQLVITTDMMVEGVHFPKGVNGGDIAERLLRVNLSDLAAKGAKPIAYVLSLALPREFNINQFQDFTKGLARVQKAYGLALWGGDTVSVDGPMSISATLFGTLPPAQMIKRNGAQVGDKLWVSGNIGDGYLGLLCALGDKQTDIFTTAERALLLGRYYRPEPRLKLGKTLRGRASASIDVSDGLLADAGHIAKVSELGLVVNLSDIPFSATAEKWINAQGVDRLAARLRLISAGDDYEIVFTAPEQQAQPIIKTSHETDVSVHMIGHCISGQGVSLYDRNGQKMTIETLGYQHFK